jgi:cytochrome P450
MNKEASLLTFDIICKILFGQDLHEQLEPCKYVDPQTGEEQTIEMHDSLEKITLDCSFAGLRPLNVIFPWLVKYDIGKLNKVNSRNSEDFVRVIKNFLETTKDKDSVYHKVLWEEPGINKDHVFADVMSFMFGGHETNSRALTTSMLYLKRCPDILKTLKEEIDTKIFQNGKFTVKDLKTILDSELVDKCEELSYFIKEALWFVPPASRSLGYVAMKPFEFSDGLRVPKG